MLRENQCTKSGSFQHIKYSDQLGEVFGRGYHFGLRYFFQIFFSVTKKEEITPEMRGLQTIAVMIMKNGTNDHVLKWRIHSVKMPQKRDVFLKCQIGRKKVEFFFEGFMLGSSRGLQSFKQSHRPRMAEMRSSCR